MSRNHLKSVSVDLFYYLAMDTADIGQSGIYFLCSYQLACLLKQLGFAEFCSETLSLTLRPTPSCLFVTTFK